MYEAPKIVGGQAATAGQFPHQAALIIGGSGFCVPSSSPKPGYSLLHTVATQGQYELSCDNDYPALFSKAGFERVHNIHSVHFV